MAASEDLKIIVFEWIFQFLMMINITFHVYLRDSSGSNETTYFYAIDEIKHVLGDINKNVHLRHLPAQDLTRRAGRSEGR